MATHTSSHAVYIETGKAASVSAASRTRAEPFRLEIVPETINIPGTAVGSLLGLLKRVLFAQSAAEYEVRNVRTGDTQQRLFDDGTTADRAARALGRDWRAYRR